MNNTRVRFRSYRMCVIALAIIVSSLPSLSPVPALAAEQDQPVVRIVEQNFELTQGTSLQLTLGLDATTEQLTKSDLKIRILNRITSNKELANSFNDVSASVVDQVNFKTNAVPRDNNGNLVLVIGIDQQGTDAASLFIRDSGIYPVAVVFQSGDMRIVTTTFIHVTSSDDPPPPRLDTTLVFNVQGKPVLQPDGTYVLAESVRSQLVALAALLEQTNAPLLIGIGPELLNGLSQSIDPNDIVLLRRLVIALSKQPLLARTYVDLDPSGAARALMHEEFNQQLRIGEDALATLFPINTITRDLWIANGVLDQPGANLLRDAGTQSVVLLPTAQMDKVDPAIDPQYVTQTANLTGGSSIRIGLVDTNIAQLLPSTSDQPKIDVALAMTRILLANERATVDTEHPTHQLFISSMTGEIPDHAVIVPLVKLLESSPYINLTTSLTIPNDIEKPSLSLPTKSEVSLSPLAGTLRSLRANVTATSSMLPNIDPRIATWQSLYAVLASDQLTTSGRKPYITTLQKNLATVRGYVEVPVRSSFTLGNKDGEIRLQFRNKAAVDLAVRVRLASSKLAFPEKSKVVVLTAGATTEVTIGVNARSNGRFPVVLYVTTPEGGKAVAPPVILTARVTALAGIGQVISFIGLLLILTWWVAHYRRSRRRRLEQGTVQ